MKSINRCKEHYQGDRCNAPQGHVPEVADGAPIPDEALHVGNFSAWIGTGDSQRVKYHLRRRASRRNRRLNRFLTATTGRQFNQADYVKGPARSKMYEMLDNAIAYLRGE